EEVAEPQRVADQGSRQGAGGGPWRREHGCVLRELRPHLWLGETLPHRCESIVIEVVQAARDDDLGDERLELRQASCVHVRDQWARLCIAEECCRQRSGRRG